MWLSKASIATMIQKKFPAKVVQFGKWGLGGGYHSDLALLQFSHVTVLGVRVRGKDLE